MNLYISFLFIVWYRIKYEKFPIKDDYPDYLDMQKLYIKHLRYAFAGTKPSFDLNKDYYRILDVKSSDSCETIKKSYFRLAKKYHPDVNPNGKCEFEKIQEAYEVLSDEGNRKEYDQSKFGNYNNNYSQKPKT